MKLRSGLRSMVLIAAAMLSTVANAQKIQWTRQFGTTGADTAYGVAVAPDAFYVVGATREQLSILMTLVGTIEAAYVLWQATAGDPLVPAGELPGKWRAFGTLGNS